MKKLFKNQSFVDAVMWFMLFIVFFLLSQTCKAQQPDYCKFDNLYNKNLTTWNDVTYSYGLMGTYGAVNYFGNGMTESQRDVLSTVGCAVTLATFITLESLHIDLGVVSRNKWVGRLIIVIGFVAVTQI